MTTEELRLLLGTDTRTRNASEWQKQREAMRQNGLDPSNYYQEVEMSSPYVNTHSDITSSYEAMALHSHNFYEIICCRNSCGAEYLIDSRRYTLYKGDVILVRPGVSHCAILPDPLTIPYERDVLWLAPSFVNSFRRIQGLPPVNYETEPENCLIRTAGTSWEFLCDRIHEGVLIEKKKQCAWQTMVIGNTLQVLSYFQQIPHSDTARVLDAETPDLLDEMIAYIEDHYREKLVMGDVAKRFYTSERTIGSLFRKRLGVTFVRFLTLRRLIDAKTRILQGEVLDAVAELSGFGDYSTFYRAFRKEFGISPQQFRKNSLAAGNKDADDRDSFAQLL